jgi:hypothetical protein
MFRQLGAIHPPRLRSCSGHKSDVLQRHCETSGRDPAEIRKTLGLGPQLKPFENLDEFMKTIESYAEAGVELINVGPLPGDQDPVGFVTRLGDEVMPRLASLG